MGRKKIRIARISDERNRHVTFMKRKAGLLKKAMELSVLCDAEIAVLVFAPRGSAGPPRFYDYASESLSATLRRLAQFTGEHESRNNITFNESEVPVSQVAPGMPVTVAASAAAHATVDFRPLPSLRNDVGEVEDSNLAIPGLRSHGAQSSDTHSGAMRPLAGLARSSFETRNGIYFDNDSGDSDKDSDEASDVPRLGARSGSTISAVLHCTGPVEQGNREDIGARSGSDHYARNSSSSLQQHDVVPTTSVNRTSRLTPPSSSGISKELEMRAAISVSPVAPAAGSAAERKDRLKRELRVHIPFPADRIATATVDAIPSGIGSNTDMAPAPLGSASALFQREDANRKHVADRLNTESGINLSGAVASTSDANLLRQPGNLSMASKLPSPLLTSRWGPTWLPPPSASGALSTVMNPLSSSPRLGQNQSSASIFASSLPQSQGLPQLPQLQQAGHEQSLLKQTFGQLSYSQTGLRSGLTGTPHGDQLWTPHSEFPTDPLITPKSSVTPGGHCPFPPLPSPSNAGLLPLMSVRSTAPVVTVPLGPPMTPRTIAAIANTGNGMPAGTSSALHHSSGPDDGQFSDNRLRDPKLSDISQSGSEIAAATEDKGQRVSSTQSVLGKRPLTDKPNVESDNSEKPDCAAALPAPAFVIDSGLVGSSSASVPEVASSRSETTIQH